MSIIPKKRPATTAPISSRDVLDALDKRLAELDARDQALLDAIIELEGTRCSVPK
jgi:hypothetical protein